MTELEIRGIVKNRERIEQKLLELGFNKLKDIMQEDIIFDDKQATLFRSGQKIRIRIEDDTAELTYKGKFERADNLSKREEINIPLEIKFLKDYVDFFESIGYPICFTIPKIRTCYNKSNTKVTFDEWPIIGCLMEIEGDAENIYLLAKTIAPTTELRNYRLKELFQNAEIETGKSLEQLKKEYQLKTNTDLGKIELIIQ